MKVLTATTPERSSSVASFWACAVAADSKVSHRIANRADRRARIHLLYAPNGRRPYASACKGGFDANLQDRGYSGRRHRTGSDPCRPRGAAAVREARWICPGGQALRLGL